MCAIFVSGGSTLGNFAILANNALFNYNLLALPVFILMGELMIYGGVAKKLYDSVLPFMERLPGGLVYANIGANTILGACTGSTIAATSAMSTVAIPEFEKRGYSKGICYGSLASAGCLEALIPPSVGMIIFCSITTVSLGKLFIAGIVPGLILASFFSIITYLWVKVDPKIVPPKPKKLMPLIQSILYAFKNLWPLFILIFIILGVIYFGIATPTEAGCYGVIGAIVLSALNKKLSLNNIRKSLFSTLKISISIFFIIAMASVYGFALNALGLKDLMLTLLLNLPGDPNMKMLFIWLIILVMGMFLDGASITIITVPILLPFAINLGFDPVWYGIFHLLAIELGNITPPVGLTLFAVQAVTGESVGVIAKGCLPYWVSFFLAEMIVLFFPILALWLPGMI